MKRTTGLGCLAALTGIALIAPPAHAFCGFYVSGADAKLFNNATQVVLMRKGTRTVLSMQNNYQGPPENFAMVVPVPVVLQEQNVATLPRAVFERVDKQSAPRLVEYWEKDPCAPEEPMRVMSASAKPSMRAAKNGGDLGVTVEAQFAVGEYQIVILSATEATGLDTWLRREKYNIPDGAEPLFKPYIEGGSKFFVAKVDVEKVKFEDGMAMLSPLRFYYDSDDFVLPVRLGLINAKDKQDLIVHVLAPGQRYELANMKNVFIPTNLDVKEDAKERFGEFYTALFDSTLENNPGAAVTEYSWDASTCDPCPQPPLNYNELATLGADVLDAPAEPPAQAKPTGPAARRPRIRPRSLGFVHTRIHLRYDKSSLGEDRVFKVGQPMVGGREVPGKDGALEQGATKGPYNTFQARYAIRYPWKGKIDCQDPVRGRWGGPPNGGRPKASPATGLAFAPRGKLALQNVVAQPIPELGIQPSKQTASPAGNVTPNADKSAAGHGKKRGCGCQTSGDAGGLAWVLLVLGALWSRRRR